LARSLTGMGADSRRMGDATHSDSGIVLENQRLRDELDPTSGAFSRDIENGRVELDKVTRAAVETEIGSPLPD